MFRKNNENKIRCAYCRTLIPKDLDGAKVCPQCRKILRCKCVICGVSFVKRDVGMRCVCFSEECLKVYRHACGSGNRFWQIRYCRWCKKKIGKVKKTYCSEECRTKCLETRKRIRKTFVKKFWESEYERLAELGKDYRFEGEESA